MSDYLLTLPRELKIHVLAKLSYIDIARLQGVCKAFRDLPTAEHFQLELESASGQVHQDWLISPVVFFWQKGGLEWMGFSPTLQKWNRLPSLRSLLPPRSEDQTTLLKDYLVASSNGLLCMDVGGSRNTEQIVVVNPLSRTVRELPPLNHRRRPVVMSIIVDGVDKTFQVVVAGCAAAGDEALSKRTEVFYSVKGEWEVTGDIPGPPYGVNVFQSGVVLNSLLFCLGVDVDTHFVLAYDVRQGHWVGSWRCRFPDEFFHLGYAGTNQQLFLCGNQVVLFWEKAKCSPAENSFCFATLKWNGDVISEAEWGDMRAHTKKGAGGLVCYPEFVCSSYKEDSASHIRQAVVLNTVEFTAEKLELEFSEDQQSAVTTLPGPPALKENEEAMYTLNPLTFSFKPSYDMTV